MEIREVAMHSPRHRGYIVRLKLLANFQQFRAVDEIAPLAVDVMNHRALFNTSFLGSVGFVSVKLALAEAENDSERHRGLAMLQAIKAVLIPIKQPVICHEALELLREIDPTFTYPTGCRQA